MSIGAGASDKPFYILVLEDDRDVGCLLREAFQADGHRCFVLRSRATAERFLQKVRPHLAIVDYQLLGGDGLSAARIAHEARVPVIVTSGYPTVREEVIGNGFSFLQKPFTLAVLMSLASQLLGAVSRAAEAGPSGLAF
jgi:DNA-binding response OmpR family regulator